MIFRMKKILLVVAIFTCSLVKAQQEVSVDLLDALVFKTLELKYEYYVSEQSSVGMYALFNFNGESADINYNEDNMFTPYFRHYFSETGDISYFGEVFMGINSGNRNGIDYTDGALGIAAGGKYVSGGGLVIEGNIGIGRNLFNEDSYEIVPRFGINIGYRFN